MDIKKLSGYMASREMARSRAVVGEGSKKKSPARKTPADRAEMSRLGTIMARASDSLAAEGKARPEKVESLRHVAADEFKISNRAIDTIMERMLS